MNLMKLFNLPLIPLSFRKKILKHKQGPSTANGPSEGQSEPHIRKALA